MYNINPGIGKNDNTYQKSIFSYNIYRTNNQQRSHVRTSNFTSSSLTPPLLNDSEVLYFNEKVLRRKNQGKQLKECSTQTSKTLLQLVKTEAEEKLKAETKWEPLGPQGEAATTNQNTRDASGCQKMPGDQYGPQHLQGDWSQNTQGNSNVSGDSKKYQGESQNLQGWSSNTQGKYTVGEPQNLQGVCNNYRSQNIQRGFNICEPQNNYEFQNTQGYNVYGSQNVQENRNYFGFQNTQRNYDMCVPPNQQRVYNYMPQNSQGVSSSYNSQNNQRNYMFGSQNTNIFGFQNKGYTQEPFNGTETLKTPVPPCHNTPLTKSYNQFNLQENSNAIRSSGPQNGPNHYQLQIPKTISEPEDPPEPQNLQLACNGAPTNRRSRSPSPVRIGLKIQIVGQDDPPLETGRMSPDSLAVSPRNFSLENCPYSVANHLSDFTLDGSCHEQDCIFNNKEKTSSNGLDKPLTQTFLEKKESMKSKSFIDNYQHPNYIQDPPEIKFRRKLTTRTNKRSCKSLDLPDNSFIRRRSSTVNNGTNSFMCPTAASLIKSKMPDIKTVNSLMPSLRRGKSTSPKPSGDKRRFESSRKIPYIDQSKSDVSSSTTLVNAIRHPELARLKDLDAEASKSDCSITFSDDILSLITTLEPSSSSFNDSTICLAINKLQEIDWRIALRGLADIVEICRVIDVDLIYDYMNTVNHRVIELLKSPRSHVCRTACQAAGHLFEYVKDTRRPVFDEMVDVLLQKTADANKFIRHDANLALDCMVTHISIFNAVRALCAKGPLHKNPLVRSATARLLVCSVVIAGASFVMNPNNNEYTRKRLILTMARLLEDRNLETRKLAERLYKVLSKDIRFDVYLKKYLESEQIVKIKKNLLLIHKK